MGENKKYYYIKKKLHPTARRLHFFSHRPEVVLQSNPAVRAVTGGNEHVLDLDFSPEKPHLGIGIIRWTLFFILAVLVYVMGAFLYAGSSDLKDNLLSRGEAGAASLQKGSEALRKLEIDNALVNFNLAEKNFNAGLTTFAELGQSNLLLAGVNFESSQILQGEAIMQTGQHLAKAGILVSEAIKPVIGYWDSLVTVGSNMSNVGEELGKILITNSSKIDLALKEVAAANTNLSLLNIAYVDPAYASLLQDAKDKALTLQTALDLMGNMAKGLPKMMGFGTPRYYLILNQNNNELRPTGGFIGSYVLIKLYQGKLESFFVDSTQRIDGQNLYNDMALPTPLKGITAYYGIRDANWEPNFPTSVRTIQKLYEQSGGGTVDGMIALNPGIIEDILSIMGPVELPKYKFALTAANFVEKTQQQIAVADKSGAYNPKQVLLDFAPVLMDRLFKANSREIRLIGNKLFQRLVSKDILLNFSDASLEDVVSKLNWGGEVRRIAATEDYLYVVTANLGGNKSSRSLVQEISHQANVQTNTSIIDHLTIKYTHTGTNKFPDGISKNYIRVYLPMGSHITKTTGQDENTQIDLDSSDGKTVAGLWLTINPGETKEIALEYELPFKLNFTNGEATYRLILQKQSGNERANLSSFIEVADNMDLTAAGGSEAVRKDMIFSDKLVKDEIVTAPVHKYR
ncbi:MAG: DUF4012 domain-containing protein [Patescibacteria group bacterium]|jgi:hypothetical protein